MAADTRIRKFTTAQIVYHWLYSGSWLVLCLTGMTFMWRADPHGTVHGLGVLTQGSVGQSLRFTHRIAALFFMSAPLVWLIMEPSKAWGEVVELLSIRKLEWKWLAIAPLYYTLGKPALPPQGKYNAGQKLNEWIVLLTYLGFAVTGVVMWLFRGSVPPESFRLMLLLHNLLFWVGLGMATLHIYLTLLHPFTRQALSAVTNGYVSLRYARSEHPLWVQEQLESGQADVLDAPAHD